MIWILKHLPAIQAIIPLLGGLFCALSFNRKVAESIAAFSALSCLLLSIIGWTANNEITYIFGSWHVPVGIEFKLSFLNIPLFIFINATLLFLIVICKNLIKTTILDFITVEREHLFYSILLFAHTGYIGMLSTNDIFNLYVFIEISSLSTYILVALGNHIYASRGAFDYLIVGSIGATLILIGIGFLLYLTGSLNITDIKLILENEDDIRILLIGSLFILTGIMLKVAFFPLHFWMIRAYNSAPTIILIYVAGISGIVGTYLFLKLTYCVLDYDVLSYTIKTIIKPTALFALLFCSYLAFKARTLKNTIIYSAAVQTSYIMLLLSIPGCKHLIFSLLIMDGINKIIIFFIIAKNKSNSVFIVNLEKFLVITTLLSSAGLPVSGMFITKINILEILIRNGLIIELVVIIISSSISLLYHFKIAKLIWQIYETKISQILQTRLETIGVFGLIVIQICMINLPNLVKHNNIWDNLRF